MSDGDGCAGADRKSVTEQESRVDHIDRVVHRNYPFFMNYMAHAFLSPPDEEILLGNMACDLIKPGNALSLSRGIREGMSLHQNIDRVTDSHPSFKAMCSLLTENAIPYGGVLVDIICDHFLALHWDDHSDETPEDFSGRVYGVLERRASSIPGHFPRLAVHLCREDWFGQFKTETGLENSLKRVNYRSSREIPVGDIMNQVMKGRSFFDENFQNLMEDLRSRFETDVKGCPQ